MDDRGLALQNRVRRYDNRWTPEPGLSSTRRAEV